MKIAIIHLSDFHIQENCRICSAKLNALVSALSVLGNVDHYVIAFSGDLAASGKINEYSSRQMICISISQTKTILPTLLQSI